MSWFTNKQKNRRLKNTQVLDVKLRSEQVRATRMRMAAIALGLIFTTIFGFYLLWRTCNWTLNRLVYDNRAFAVQDIDIQTDGVIAVGQLRRWAGIKPGENLIALDLARVKRDLEMVPLIRFVAVERLLPHTLRLRITERESLAQIYVPQARVGGGIQLGILHLDADGFVMNLLDPSQRSSPPVQTNDTLPVIYGLNPNELVPGRRVDSAAARSALALISAFDRSTMSSVVDLERIDVSSPQVLTIITSQGSQVTFSLTDFDRQLRRWQEVHDLGQKTSKVLATLDLSVPNNIPARWIEAGTAPPATPRNNNPQHNRKKNV